MSQIPPLSIHPTSADNLSVSQQNRQTENADEPKRVTTNVTLNPQDSALDSLPAIHWSDLPKAPPNYLNNMDGAEKSKTNAQGMVMETANKNITDARNSNGHDRRSETPGQQASSIDYNPASRINNNSSIKSFRNTSNDEFTPPPTRTPPYKTGMPGYQPISPYHNKRQQQKVEKSAFRQDASGRKLVIISFTIAMIQITAMNL